MGCSERRVRIPDYRLAFIDKMVDAFRLKYAINHVPIDCVAFVMQLQCSINPKIRIRSTADLKSGQLARTIFVRSENLYLISINRNQLYDSRTSRVKYPFLKSPDRMLNFTVAHELGHIALEHTDIPDSLKDKETVLQEDLEADEFAARLLMPEQILISCNFVSVAAVARAFLVSESALLRRLAELGRQDLRQVKAVPLCSVCSRGLEKTDNFCSGCGTDVRRNKNGVLRQRTVQNCMGQLYEMCAVERAVYRKCVIDSFENCCTAKDCNALALPESAYCTACGSETAFKRQRLVYDYASKHSLLCDQMALEAKLRAKYGEVLSVVGWAIFVGRLEYEFRYLLDKSFAVVADGSLIVCPHSWVQVELSTGDMSRLTRRIKRFAKLNGACRVEVASTGWLDRSYETQRWSGWLKSRHKMHFYDLVDANSMERKLTDVGNSVYDFIRFDGMRLF